ncbi:hypothetical protein ACLBOM_13645 [Escherichia coli]
MAHTTAKWHRQPDAQAIYATQVPAGPF